MELPAAIQSARDVGGLVSAITKAAKQFGEIENWAFFRDRERCELRIFVSLEIADNHEALAAIIGGKVEKGRVILVVPQQEAATYADSIAPRSPAHDLAPDT